MVKHWLFGILERHIFKNDPVFKGNKRVSISLIGQIGCHIDQFQYPFTGSNAGMNAAK
ncbi:hypothetical protein D9M68_482050 [compost metagenome]